MRPLTVWHRTGWAWICPECAASESDFVMEHHARTIADEHVRTHRPELTSSTFVEPHEESPVYDPIPAQLVLQSVERSR